ncbi:MAG: cobalt-precorrin-5B (C(1))-methyltransferase CbiD [Candidatus Magnetominusculus sp. LBB02]|nr:cobalt-precorrin-5B (C(1))-methyltransferase CbiD [Candidatus Magnetominusculus sp. LBB02]
MKTELRKGFTTGTAAAAAAKAASMFAATGTLSDNVSITLPDGLTVLDIKTRPASRRHQSGFAASVIKDGGDDPDATHGLEIIAAVRFINNGGTEVTIKGGKGVGMVTKPGLQIPVGTHALNPVPRSMIRAAVREAVPTGLVEVEIIVPDGEAAAAKTFNSRLGIIGGISIIGTTGIVEPMSMEAVKAAVACELDVAYEENSSRVYLSPGKIGEDALKAVFPGVHVVQMSNFIGDALLYAKKKGFKEVVVGGHPGKLAKLLMGYYDTHSKNSPQAAGFVAKLFGLEGQFITVEEIIEYVKNRDKFNVLAHDIAAKINSQFSFSSVETLLFNMKKQLIGRAVCIR